MLLRHVDENWSFNIAIYTFATLIPTENSTYTLYLTNISWKKNQRFEEEVENICNMLYVSILIVC